VRCSGPSVTLSGDADIPAETDLFGKVVSDLQENVSVAEDGITGTSKYVTGYTGFSGDPELQSGNYLALHFEDDAANAIYVKLIGGSGNEVQLDSDGIIVLRITDAATAVSVRTTTAGGAECVNEFDLNVTLEAE